MISSHDKALFPIEASDVFIDFAMLPHHGINSIYCIMSIYKYEIIGCRQHQFYILVETEEFEPWGL